ncbi:MAG: NERD domain-containing protein [Sporomusaceae bacterium]|nr:NERD domain-containing protein [Sporomusaceae bacterium]
MAQFHKGRNNLSSKANKNLIAGLLVFTLVVMLFYVVFVHRVQVDKWYYFLPIMILMVFASYYIRRGIIFGSGAKGEDLGLVQALQLPEGYHVFTNVTISYHNYSQEIDLIIVGTKGVYVVEVKHHNGKIVGNAEAAEWVQHKVGRGGGRYSKKIQNPVKQVKGQVYKLSKLLKENGINVWVEGMILFTNEGVNVSVQNSSIPILFPARRLSHYILTCNNRQYLNKTLINKVVEMISSKQKE